MGTSGARTGLGMLSKNQAAMDALGKVGAAAIVNSAHGSLNKAGGQQGQGQAPSPTSPVNNYGGGGGGGGMAAVAPPPSRGAPPRRNATPVAAPADMGQARAEYDYEGADSTDLTVQKGQVIYINAKTSEDCEYPCTKKVEYCADSTGWTCEDANGRKGLVPSAYLKEL